MYHTEFMYSIQYMYLRITTVAKMSMLAMRTGTTDWCVYQTSVSGGNRGDAKNIVKGSCYSRELPTVDAPFNSFRIVSYRIASHRIASHRIASYYKLTSNKSHIEIRYDTKPVYYCNWLKTMSRWGYIVYCIVHEWVHHFKMSSTVLRDKISLYFSIC